MPHVCKVFVSSYFSGGGVKLVSFLSMISDEDFKGHPVDSYLLNEENLPAVMNNVVLSRAVKHWFSFQWVLNKCQLLLILILYLPILYLLSL